MRIIPAIDIIDGQCVRLSKGDYSTAKIYSNDPLEMAKAFQDHGVEYLHLVDLDGAKSHGIVNHKVLEKIATKTNFKIDFGGGLKTDQDLKIAFESGAKQITGGSIAIKDPATFLSWIETYGAHRIILGADEENKKIAISYKSGDTKVFLNGTEIKASTMLFSGATLNDLSFESASGSVDFYGNTKDLQVYPKALSDAELIKLTTI